VAFSPDGKQIVSGSEDKTIKLWDATAGGLQKTLAGHSGRVTAVAFSPDGKQIASGSDDNTIKLWDVAKSLKVSKLLGNTFGSHLKFRAWREIKTSKLVSSLKFSTNGRYLVTNLGQIKIESILTNRQSFGFESLENLWVGNQWIYYGAMPVFLLPSDFELQCHDVRGDQLTIGFRNGRVLSFDMNRISLNSIFKNSV
jgi:dipeptidyl aminopeptidase/acylaminoacyl peptidase